MARGKGRWVLLIRQDSGTWGWTLVSERESLGVFGLESEDAAVVDGRRHAEYRGWRIGKVVRRG